MVWLIVYLQVDTKSLRRPTSSVTGGGSTGGSRARERERKTPASTMPARQPMQNNTVSPSKTVKIHIPFAQRQAKSEVAAREMLKKAEKVQCYFLNLLPLWPYTVICESHYLAAVRLCWASSRQDDRTQSSRHSQVRPRAVLPLPI